MKVIFEPTCIRDATNFAHTSPVARRCRCFGGWRFSQLYGIPVSRASWTPRNSIPRDSRESDRRRWEPYDKPADAWYMRLEITANRKWAKLEESQRSLRLCDNLDTRYVQTIQLHATFSSFWSLNISYIYQTSCLLKICLKKENRC